MRHLEKELQQRLLAAVGIATPGDYNYLADILEIVRNETESWTNRTDDAIRIPHRIDDAAKVFRMMAKQFELLEARDVPLHS